MLRGDTVLGEQPATDLDLRNGQKLRVRKGVTMPKEPGSYSVLIKMIYKDKVATKQVPIKVR